MFLLSIFFLNGALLAGSQREGGLATPENVTVRAVDSNTVELFWSTNSDNVERYDIAYSPTKNRVVSQAAGDSRSFVLRELRPKTQYQVTVTAVVGGKTYKSRRIFFRTSENPPNETTDPEGNRVAPTGTAKLEKSRPTAAKPDPTAVGSDFRTPLASTTVRGVEIGLVLLALVVWMVAIALFFHRWGKIRMLLPYQPDYKTQQSLKVPGTGASMVSGCAGNSAARGRREGPGCVQSIYERVTACRCCCERIAGSRATENEESDIDE